MSIVRRNLAHRPNVRNPSFDMDERQPLLPSEGTNNPPNGSGLTLPRAPPAYDDISTVTGDTPHLPPPYREQPPTRTRTLTFDDDVESEVSRLCESPQSTCSSMESQPGWIGYYGDRLPPVQQPRGRFLQSAASEPVDEPRYTHRPVFTVLIAIVDISLIVFELVVGGVVDISFQSEPQTEQLHTFGSPSTSITKHRAANIFIGPSAKFLVSAGAKFVPCMRDDMEWIKKVEEEKQREESYNTCCVLNNDCRMLDKASCWDIGGTSTSASACDADSTLPDCKQGVTARPCCFGVLGNCSIITEEHCSFLNGIWHQDKTLCSEVNCLVDLCGMGLTEHSKPNQWNRFIIPMFLHVGVIHLVLNLLVQTYLCTILEKQIGCCRIMLIYLASGIGGNLLCGLFNPTVPQVGSSGAIFGLMALEVVLLFRNWRSAASRCCELFKLIFIIFICFAVGTLPYISNYVHIGGFIFGWLVSCLLVPEEGCRRCSIRCLLSLIAFVGLSVILFFLFYKVQDTEWCTGCHYLDCIPWTRDMCPYSIERKT